MDYIVFSLYPQLSSFFLRFLMFYYCINLKPVLKIERLIDLLFPQEIGPEKTRNTGSAPESFQQEIM